MKRKKRSCSRKGKGTKKEPSWKEEEKKDRTKSERGSTNVRSKWDKEKAMTTNTKKEKEERFTLD